MKFGVYMLKIIESAGENMTEMRRAIKDSVFTYLFRQPEYMFQLYQTLHPEDKTTTEADLKLVTIENVLSTGFYNDLGFRVGDTVLALTEAQSTFSANISLRLLLYLARTYQEYVEEKKLDLYAPKAVKIPRPELYVVYTGRRKDTPETLYLSDLYIGMGSVDLTIRVLRRDGSGSIIDQYARFCEIADEQRGKYGYTQEAIDETIRQCIEEGVLVLFLESREKEVTDIMVTLFDEEKIKEFHDYNLRAEVRAEVRAEALAEGRKEGLAEGNARGMNKMSQLGQILFGEGKISDLQRAFTDSEFRDSLLTLYGL